MESKYTLHSKKQQDSVQKYINNKSRIPSNKRVPQADKIEYEAEDEYAGEAFKKYLFLKNDPQTSKAGAQMSMLISSSEQQLKKFKHARDSEFNAEDKLKKVDLTELKLQRNAVINPINEDDSLNVQVIRINRGDAHGGAAGTGLGGGPSKKSTSPTRNRGGSKDGIRRNKRSLERNDINDELISNFEADEDQLISSLQQKRQGKAKFVEQVRDRQSKMMQLNEKIRKFDLKKVKEDEYDGLKSQIEDINQQWGSLKQSIEDKLKFVERVHRKHNQEVQDYNRLADDLDQKKLVQRIQRLNFQLQTDIRDTEKSAEDLISERDKNLIFIDRAKRTLAEETSRNNELKAKLMQDETPSVTAEKMKRQIEKMRNEMQRINSYSIDMSTNPKQAIQNISDPILELLNLKVEECEQKLQEYLIRKKDADANLTLVKNKIFEEKVTQINLRMKKEELKSSLLTLAEDITKVKDRVQENIKRKSKLAERIQETTNQFKDEAMQLKLELSRVQNKLKEVYQHKERVEDQALFLVDDRGSYGAPQKYKKSIYEFVELAKSLTASQEKLKQKILKLDEILTVENMYKSTDDKIEKFYKCGKFIEKEKADTMIQDLQMKQDLIMDMQADKEAVEQQLAAFGSIHFIYKTFNDVQDEIKTEIKRHLREKNQVFQYLENLALDFAKNRKEIGLQEWKLRTQNATHKALQYLLQEKLLTQRIVEDEFAKAKEALEGKPQGNFSLATSKPINKEEDLNAFEHELHFKMTQELHTREKDAKLIVDLLRTKEQEIQNMRNPQINQREAQKETIVEEKAKAVLRKYGFKGQVIKICKNTFKLVDNLGNQVYAYLQSYEQQGQLEDIIVCKVSVKGETVKTIPTVTINQETYLNFEKFVERMIKLAPK